jgi:hypothetical protein
MEKFTIIKLSKNYSAVRAETIVSIQLVKSEKKFKIISTTPKVLIILNTTDTITMKFKTDEEAQDFAEKLFKCYEKSATRSVYMY